MSDTEPLFSKEDDSDSSGSASSDIRIVLLGKTGSGKSSAGNTILYQEYFKKDVSAVSITKTCKKSEKKRIGDWMISVIDTPGLFDTTMSEQDLKNEIVRCVYESAPGPHVFLLVIKVGRFTAEEKNAVKWIQENFGEEAAPYIIILFTHADQLKGKSLKNYISESSDLQALVKVCGGRFHLFNNEDMRNRSQITELLKIIDKMVEKNGGQYYTNEMYQKAQKNKQFWLEKPRIVLLGEARSGKTCTKNTIAVQDRRNSRDSADEICELELDGRSMTIIDISEQKIRDEINNLVFMSASGPHVFLLVIRLDRFTGKEKNTVKWIKENFGKEAANYTIILFTHADYPRGDSLDEYIRESNDRQALVDECGGSYHSFNLNDMSNQYQVTELLRKIEMIMEKNEWRCYTSDMYKNAQEKILDRANFWLEKPRIVLLGEARSGKTCTKNTIAVQDRRNSQDSAAEICELKLDGRSMTIIDISEQKIRDEINNLVFMSASGPHVFLLVIRLDRFTGKEKNTVKWIKENFGKEAANYTIILFTHADYPRGNSLDEYIRESNDRQALVDECGGSYHSFNNNDMSNQYQVTELLRKIEMIMEKNEWRCYTSDMYKNAQEKILDRANFWSSKPRIVLLGETGSGKTSTAVTIVGRTCFTNTYEKQEACVDGKKMKIIDTPGLIDVPEENIQNEIEKLVFMSDPGPHVFLLVIKLGAIFREENNIVRWFQENVGEDALRHTIILFTHADHLRGNSLDEYIRERPYLQSLVHSCGGRFQSFNNQSRNNQVTELLEKIENTAEINKWQYYTNEKFKNILNNYIHKLRNIALSVGPVGTAGIIAGGIVLGVTEVVAAPAVLIVVGSVALVGGAVFGGRVIYKRFVKKD